MLKVSNSRLLIFHTSNRVYQHEKVGEKVGENRDKFYLSPTICQHVCQLFLCVKAAFNKGLAKLGNFVADAKMFPV